MTKPNSVDAASLHPTVMRFIEQPIAALGEVKIIRDLVPDNFQGCKIVQHGGTFRLHEDRGTSTSSFTVNESDALWIIDAMGLGASLSIALRRVVIWQ
ncbi:MAG: hypothetical protein FJ308_13330 [Planctomycetes bacterium]|nr:hypothetical protein [Planctomycetota bacterium]